MPTVTHFCSAVRNFVFTRIALATGAPLFVPLVAMQFTSEVAWDWADFIVMGSLIFGMSSLFVFVARKLPSKRRLFVGVTFFVVFLYIWAELAVGVLSDLA